MRDGPDSLFSQLYRLRYKTPAGQALALSSTSGKAMYAIVGCILAIGVGVILRLFAELQPEIVVRVTSELADFGIAVWRLLYGIASSL